MRQSFEDDIPDCALLNHNGEVVRFFTELVKDRAVVINFFYTDCQKSCPPTNVAIRRLRKALSPSFGGSVRFLSITLQPGKDTVQRLAEYARANAPAEDDPDLPKWDFLTGNPEHIYSLRRALGLYETDPFLDADPSQHGSVLLVGNHATGRWTKVNALGNPSQIHSQTKRIIGWTAAQRYEDVRRAVAETREYPIRGAHLSSSISGPPILGQLSGSIEGTTPTGELVSTAKLSGKLVVFGRIDAHCPHAIHAVASTMERLHQQFGHFEGFQLVSLTSSAPAQLSAWDQPIAPMTGEESNEAWWILSAQAPNLDPFVQHSLGLHPNQLIPEDERLNPSETHIPDLRLVLVDWANAIRGRYEVFHADTALGVTAAERLEEDIRQLLNQRSHSLSSP